MTTSPIALYPLRLNNGNIFLLNLVLNRPGWAETLLDVYAGGKLLSRLPNPTPEGDYATWANGNTQEFALSDKDLECCRKAFRHSPATLTPSPWIVSLLDQLQLSPTSL